MKTAATSARAQEKGLSRLLTAPIALAQINPARTVRYVGAVTRVTTERVLRQIEKLMDKDQNGITLFVSSTGGPTGTAVSFYDTVHQVLRASLTTIGSGDVDSSGILIFLTGDTRYVTKHTTLLFHTAGRRFGAERYTTREMEAMLAEDKLKDEQYADLVAQRSRGQLSKEGVLSMMEKNTVLTPDELVTLGLADGVLD